MTNGRNTNRFTLGVWNGRGHHKNYDTVSLSGEPLLQREELSISTNDGDHASPQQQVAVTTTTTTTYDTSVLPKSNTTSTTTTTCSCEGVPNPTVVLYDSNSMLELSSSLCQGYVTLLSTGKASEGRSTIELAYAAITDGNVIDVCFGIVSFSANGTANASTLRRVKDAKEIIDDLINSNLNDNDEQEGALEEMVVRSYCTSFQSIIQMHDRMNRLNFITKCFCSHRIRQNTLQSIQDNFTPLQQKIRLLLQHRSQQSE
jgi:hypothetical protein